MIYKHWLDYIRNIQWGRGKEIGGDEYWEASRNTKIEAAKVKEKVFRELHVRLDIKGGEKNGIVSIAIIIIIEDQAGKYVQQLRAIKGRELN